MRQSMTNSITKADIKFIQSLKQKRARVELGCFVAEGNKMVGDILNLIPVQMIVATEEWLKEHPVRDSQTKVIVANRKEIEQISFLKTPQDVIAVLPIREYGFERDIAQRELCLALDGVQDPGNLGTIVRIADWFGIEHIFCSKECADLYNPKTVQSTMGAFVRVKVIYVDLLDFLASQQSVPLYGTLLDGDNIYKQELTPHGIIVMGSEGQGISPEIESLITHRLFLPNYPAGKACTESLNVAIATSLTCAEFRRRTQFNNTTYHP